MANGEWTAGESIDLITFRRIGGRKLSSDSRQVSIEPWNTQAGHARKIWKRVELRARSDPQTAPECEARSLNSLEQDGSSRNTVLTSRQFQKLADRPSRTSTQMFVDLKGTRRRNTYFSFVSNISVRRNEKLQTRTNFTGIPFCPPPLHFQSQTDSDKASECRSSQHMSRGDSLPIRRQ
jgi:hypothetical protein